MLKPVLAIIVIVIVGAMVRTVVPSEWVYLCGFTFGCIAIAAANVVERGDQEC